MSEAKQALTPDKKLAAVCGLFCPACHVYLASQAGSEQLEATAKRFQKTVKEMECHGCRSDKRCFFCEEKCTFVSCAKKKGAEFCGQCPDYPCSDLKVFQSLAPHRLELWNSHERIKTKGWETWFAEMAEMFACPDCGTLNSAYHLACRQCGRTPSNQFAEKHQDKIKEHMAKRG